MENKANRPFLIAGGICAVVWPLLSELMFYALYPLLAGADRIPVGAGMAEILRGTAALGDNRAIVALEWSKVVAPVLLLVFLSALHHLLRRRGAQGLAQIAFGLGALSVAFSILANTFNSTLNHALGEAYVHAGSEAEQAAILAVFESLGGWHRGINQTASLLYQGCIALFGIALIRSRIWSFWGGVGLAGATLALIAKLTPGIAGVTNFTWTGLAYFFWPIALGVGLIRVRIEATDERRSGAVPAAGPPAS
jgi:hypothetical protein